LSAWANPNCINREGKKAGDEFEMVFVDKKDGEIIRNALDKARKQWSQSKD